MIEWNPVWQQPISGKKRKKEINPFGSGIGFGFSHAPKKETERDTRRAFSQTQRNEIWDRQKGKCAGSYCGHKPLLRSATHYDHIIPWEKGGKTVVSNGQALCTICHSIKSNKDRLKKIDKKRKQKSDKSHFGGGYISGLQKKYSKRNPFGL